MPTVMLIFVQPTFVLVTSIHIRNISAVTDSILTTLLRLALKIVFDFSFLEPDHFTQNFGTQNLLDSKFFGRQNFMDLKFFWTCIFLTLIYWTKTYWDLTFFLPKIVLDPTLLGLNFFRHGLFLDQKVFGPNLFLTKNKNNNNNNHNQSFNGFWHNWN